MDETNEMLSGETPVRRPKRFDRKTLIVFLVCFGGLAALIAANMN